MFPFKMALNASTLFPFKLDIKEQITIAAQAGYEGIEIWVRDIFQYLERGGSVSELRKHIDDSGLTVVNAIAFFPWADVDTSVREQGLVQAEKEMCLLQALGCASTAAPPYGDVEGVTLDDMAQRFARLVEVGRNVGVEPYLEFWGRAKQLFSLSQAMYVAIQSGVSGAKILLDPFHMYTGGSAIAGLEYVKGSHIGIVHVNDYPAQPPRSTITDADRVFPGDGIVPTKTLATLLQQTGYHDFLSLELFMSETGEHSALDIATIGLAKCKNAFSIE